MSLCVMENPYCEIDTAIQSYNTACSKYDSHINSRTMIITTYFYEGVRIKASHFITYPQYNLDTSNILLICAEQSVELLSQSFI